MNPQQQTYYDQITSIVVGKGGRVISDRYIKMVDKMLFDCGKGHQWDTEARSILKGMWCRYCHGNTQEQGEINFKKRVVEKGGTVLSEYKNNETKVLVQCHLGHQWEVFPHNLTVGKWCPACGYVNHGGGDERFYTTVKEHKGKILGDYVNTRTRIQVQCDKGHIWTPKPYYIVIGNWCPICTGSNGENIITIYLDSKNISYKIQSTISGLPRKRFDFIIKYRGKIIIIEYDGEMHFKYIPYYHINEEFFHYRRSVDRVKTLYAFNNNYQIIRIDYTQLLNINAHLDYALELDTPLYVSTPALYQNWLIGNITNEEIQTVYNGRNRPDYVSTEIAGITNILSTLTI